MNRWKEFVDSLKNADVMGRSEFILDELALHDDHDKAKLSLLKELEKKPKSANMLFAMGYLLTRKQDYYSALRYYDKCIDIKHNDTAIYNKAEILIQFINDAEGGLKTIESFRGDGELEQGIQELKAKALLNLENFSECEKICIENLEKYPSTFTFIRIYADCCYEQENFQKSFDLNETILEQDSTDIDAKNNKADLLIRLEKYDDALKICDDMISQNSSDVQALANKGEIFIKKSQFKEARILLENCVNIDPTYHEAWLLLAKAQTLCNSIDDALDSLMVAMSFGTPKLLDKVKENSFDNIRNDKRFQRIISKYSEI
jgi:tetratricopeptide (TPR) repeat protein